MRKARSGKFSSFSTTKYTTFRVQELNEKGPANIVVALVGNKVDLDNRQVKKEEADEYAKSLGLKYYEVSAK